MLRQLLSILDLLNCNGLHVLFFEIPILLVFYLCFEIKTENSGMPGKINQERDIVT